MIEVVVLVLVGFGVAVVCTPAGLSGAFLLLPIQVQFLDARSPTVSATNLLYNVVATPAGSAAFRKRDAIDSTLAKFLLAGVLPGMVVGVLLRSTWFADARTFAWPAAIVLVVVGARLVVGVVRPPSSSEDRHDLPTVGRILAIGAVAGAIGGVYGIGGAALSVPWLVGVERLRVDRVAGAAFVVTFVSSCVGLATFVGAASVGFGEATNPNWSEGLALGIGGAFGSILGAGLQPYVPVRALRLVIAVAALSAAVRMLL